MRTFFVEIHISVTEEYPRDQGGVNAVIAVPVLGVVCEYILINASCGIAPGCPISVFIADDNIGAVRDIGS